MGILELFGLSAENKHRKLGEEAELRFQLQEYDGEIWITFNGCLVCPSSMLKAEPVQAVKEMRELYVKRHENNEKDID